MFREAGPSVIPMSTYHQLDEGQRLVAQVIVVCQPIAAQHWRKDSAGEEEGDPFDHDDGNDNDDEYWFLCDMLLTFIPKE